VLPANSKGLQPTRLPLQQSATEVTWFHSFKNKYRGHGQRNRHAVSASSSKIFFRVHRDFRTRKSYRVVRPDAGPA